MESINCLSINHSIVKKVFYKCTLPQTPFFLFSILVIIPRNTSSSYMYAIKSYTKTKWILLQTCSFLCYFTIGIFSDFLAQTYNIKLTTLWDLINMYLSSMRLTIISFVHDLCIKFIAYLLQIPISLFLPEI